MLRREVTVHSENGLHLRPMSLIARVVVQHQCDVRIGNGEKTVDASSPLNLMSLNAKAGSQLILEADGPDELAVLEELIALFESNFEIPDEE
ncbi:MAG: HPr family phosphocarrier protein [Planctomycetaceae bacterium]